MKYKFNLNLSASISPQYLKKICPNGDPTDPATEKAVNDYFQNQIDALIAGKYVSSKQHAESINRLQKQKDEALKRAENDYIEATSRPYDK